MDVNTNGVLYTAQAAGQQMLRFGNRGSIILIASMSGSITNKVIVFLNQGTSNNDSFRTMHGCHTTRAIQRSSKWHVAWLVNSAQKTSASTRSLQGTYTHRRFYLSNFVVFPQVDKFRERMTAAYIDTQPHL